MWHSWHRHLAHRGAELPRTLLMGSVLLSSQQKWPPESQFRGLLFCFTQKWTDSIILTVQLEWATDRTGEEAHTATGVFCFLICMQRPHCTEISQRCSQHRSAAGRKHQPTAHGEIILVLLQQELFNKHTTHGLFELCWADAYQEEEMLLSFQDTDTSLRSGDTKTCSFQYFFCFTLDINLSRVRHWAQWNRHSQEWLSRPRHRC